jgi:hypothetical protein
MAVPVRQMFNPTNSVLKDPIRTTSSRPKSALGVT